MYPNADNEHDLHLAFSGGGYRAAAFCLGVLACVIDQNLLPRVRSITSVSGGSFLNVFIAQHLDVEELDDSHARKVVNDFAHRLATRSIYFATPRVAAYSFALIASAVIMVVSLLTVLASAAGWSEFTLPAMMVFVSACALCGWLLSLRNAVLVSAIRNAFCLDSEWLGKTAGRGSEGRCHHVVCATDLVRAEPVFFSRDGVRCRTFGHGAQSVEPAKVVAFSAAFPGLMRPFRMRAAKFFPSPTRAPEGDLVLVDGGVLNNLGTQWWEPAAGGGTGTFEERAATVFVDASVALPSWTPSNLQFSKTLAAASRAFSLIYFNSVRPRFDNLRRQGTLNGSVAVGVSLAENPIRALRANMMRDSGGRVTALAKQILDREEAMVDRAVRVQSVPTNLTALGVNAVSDLVAHGYYLAMIELAGVAMGGRQRDGIVLEDWFQILPKTKP